MKRISCFMFLSVAIAMCLSAQTMLWEALIPFESDDDAPVGIDITESGDILVAYYTNGPNEGDWAEDSLYHSPITKVARFDSSGDLINTEDHGQLFSHSVTGIGIAENGYTLSGNVFSPFYDGANWFYPLSALLINFRESGRDTIEYITHDDYEYNCTKLKTSSSQKPVTFISKYPSVWTGTGGASENFVINLKDSLMIHSDHISVPDTIDFEKGSFDVSDIDVSSENGTILTGRMINPAGYDDHLVYLIRMDTESNVLWENYHFIWTDVYRYYFSVSHTPDGGCIAGAYSDANYLMKYNSEGNLEYSLGPYPGSLLYNYVEFIHFIGNNEYLFKIKGNNTVYKIIDTGTGLIEDWCVELEGLKAVRAVENGFVAAGVREGNIWIKRFDATTGIEDTSGLPSVTVLHQNYPNPFNPVTQLKFDLAKTCNVKLSIYNVNGQKIAELADGIRNAGFHDVEFDGSRLNSGVYYYTLEVDSKSMTKRMLMVK